VVGRTASVKHFDCQVAPFREPIVKASIKGIQDMFLEQISKGFFEFILTFQPWVVPIIHEYKVEEQGYGNVTMLK
jgi:hypothetical protein